MSEESDKNFFIGVKKDKETQFLRGFKVGTELEKVAIFKKKANLESNEIETPKDEFKPSFKSLFEEMADTLESFRALGPLAGGLLPIVMSSLAMNRLMPFLETEAKMLEAKQGEDGESYDIEIYTAPVESFAKLKRIQEQIRQNDLGISQLPRMIVVGLIADYDAFVAKLIRIGLLNKPEIINQSDKQFKFTDLMRFQTMEEAKAFVVEKEIDATLREDHKEQLLSVGKLFNLKIPTDKQFVLGFLEACERRNLFTHVGGVVTDRYLQKCKEYGIDVSKISVGEKLDVSSKYYKSVVKDVYEVSVRLCQSLWRKLCPDQREEADRALNTLVYNLTLQRDYKLARRLLEYGCNEIKHSSDLYRRMMVVNHANVMKLDGDSEGSKKMLAKEDWSASGLQFQISVAAVLDDVDEVVRLMPLVVAANEVTSVEFREWPVFESIRDHPDMRAKFKDIFKEDIALASLNAEPNSDGLMEKLDDDTKNGDAVVH